MKGKNIMLSEKYLQYKATNRIAVLAGAGLSQESGIPTFRDAGGLWNNFDVETICNYKKFHLYKKEVFDFYNKLKVLYSSCEPNDAHYALADLQSYYGADKMTIYTSNVDMLLEEAGCSRVYHVHGDCEHSKCLDCSLTFHIGDKPFDAMNCPNCKSNNIKPGVIFFNEAAPLYEQLYDEFSRHFYKDERSGQLREKIKVVVGTSFQVITEDMLHLGIGPSLLVDKNPVSNAFTDVMAGSAVECAEKMKDWVKMNVSNL